MSDEVKDVLHVKELIATKVMGVNSITLKSGVETANGTATVTISNVAPAGVGTATISKWLTIIGSDGVTYYIPMWT